MTIQLRIHKYIILHFMIKPSKNIRHGHSFDINSSDKGQTIAVGPGDWKHYSTFRYAILNGFF